MSRHIRDVIEQVREQVKEAKTSSTPAPVNGQAAVEG
jgi:hypothetical protein